MALVDDFSLLGVSSRSFPAELVGKHAGERCLVVATARGVWADLETVGIERIRPDGEYGWHVMAVNDMIAHWPGVVHHAYSNQHRWLDAWVRGRRETIAGYVVRQRWGEVRLTHSNNVGGKVQWPWPGHGTSTLNAIYTALALGYAPVVVCGAPLTNDGHYFDPPWVGSNFEREIGHDRNGELQYWAKSARKIFGGRVFSQSGRTRELLGAFA